jgi:hypothetical protein
MVSSFQLTRTVRLRLTHQEVTEETEKGGTSRHATGDGKFERLASRLFPSLCSLRFLLFKSFSCDPCDWGYRWFVRPSPLVAAERTEAALGNPWLPCLFGAEPAIGTGQSRPLEPANLAGFRPLRHAKI